MGRSAAATTSPQSSESDIPAWPLGLEGIEAIGNICAAESCVPCAKHIAVHNVMAVVPIHLERFGGKVLRVALPVPFPASRFKRQPQKVGAG